MRALVGKVAQQHDADQALLPAHHRQAPYLVGGHARRDSKKLFFIALGVYLAATAASALSWNFWSFVLLRFLTGAGIGGKYTAINSTLLELMPVRVRGWADFIIEAVARPLASVD